MASDRRVIRALVSSTYRDVHAERDYLNRMIFPELRSRCERAGATFVALDLRWGVTEQESRRHGALQISVNSIFAGLFDVRQGRVNAIATSYLRARRRGRMHRAAL